VIGVDEHVWRHTHRGDKYVTVIIDLTPVRDKTGPAARHDRGPLQTRFPALAVRARPQDWRNGVEVVAMDGFSGFKTAATEELPEAATVMDPFHVVRLARQRPRRMPPPGTSNGPDRSDQRPPRTPPRIRPSDSAT